MGKALDADPDEPLAAAAARIVRQRTDELEQAADGVLDTADPEPLHDMRVATRRLRAVLEIFAVCFPKGELAPLLKEVKAMADALGERRDPDVQIEALEALSREAQVALRPGIGLLVARLRERQAAANADLAVALEAARERGLIERLRALADTEPAA